jgi:outer membrane lipoprotein-sorting protein
MKKIISLSLVAGIMLAASLQLAHAQAGLVSSVINRMARSQRSLKTLRANLTVDKYNSQLRLNDIYQGIIFYIPGPGGNSNAFVRLEYTSPQHETLVVAYGNYQLWRPRLNTVIEGKTSKIKSDKDNDVLALLSMSAAQLRTRFAEPEEPREETLWGGVWTQHLKLVPNGPASYNYLEVWVDKEGMPVQTKMVEKNDDATTVRLSNIERNQSIPMDQFKLNLDPSVKRVKG